MQDNKISKILGIKIQEVICISLIDAEKRRNETIDECKKFNFTPKFHIVEKNINPVLGCLESHIFCINYAKQNNLENILILEDDIRFDMNVFKSLKHINIPNDFDMIYLGYNPNRGHRIGDNLLHLISTFTTHAYIINHTIYDYVLDNINKDWKQISDFKDLNIYESQYNFDLRAIDVFYAKCVHHKRIKSYGIYPMFAFQRPEFSSIENNFVDYTNIFINKSQVIANNTNSRLIKSVILSGSYYNNKKELERQFSELDYDYDYILVSDEKNKYWDNPDYKKIKHLADNNPSWDILYLSDSNYFLRKKSIQSNFNIFASYPSIKNQKSNYLTTNYTSVEKASLLKIISIKPLLVFYTSQEIDTLGFKNFLENLKQYYYIFVCLPKIKHNIENDIVYISHNDYNKIPNHILIIYGQPSFFIEQECVVNKIIYWETNKIINQVKSWDNEILPYNGYALLQNMKHKIIKIVLDSNETLQLFVKKSLFMPDCIKLISNDFHNYKIKTNKGKTNTIGCFADENVIEFFKKLKELNPFISMTMFGCSKSLKNKYKNMIDLKLLTHKKVDYAEFEFWLNPEKTDDYWEAIANGCIYISNDKTIGSYGIKMIETKVIELTTNDKIKDVYKNILKTRAINNSLENITKEWIKLL